MSKISSVIIKKHHPDYSIYQTVKNHQSKLVALPDSGFACPPLAAISIHQLKLVVLKLEE